jgi:hypothetical protein
VLVDAGAYFEQLQVIRCNIKLELVEKSRDVENDTISEKKKQRVYTLRPHFSSTGMFSLKKRTVFLGHSDK